MKENKVARTVYDIHYEATDGTKFVNREECEKYEQTAKAIIRTRFLKLVVNEGTEYHYFNVGSDDDSVYAVKLNSREDADTVLAYYYITNPSVLEENNIYYKERAVEYVETALKEQDIIFIGENYDGDIYIINTRNNIIKGLQNIDQSKKEVENVE